MGRKICALLLLILILVVPVGVGNADVTDNIKIYEIAVEPQMNGDLKMAYHFNWCFLTDYTGSEIFLEMGVPNSDFDLLEQSGADVKSGKELVKSGRSYVRIDFNREYRANECADFRFTILQRGMIHVQGEDASFQLIPGWYDSATTDKIVVTWKMPDDPALLKQTDPTPVIANGLATWEMSQIGAGKKVSVSVLYAKVAFPDWKEPVAPPVVQPESSSSGSGGLSPLCWGIIILLLIVGVVLLIMWMSGAFEDSYSSGSYVGGYTSSPSTYTGSRRDDDRPSRPSCASTYKPSCASTSKPSCASRPSSSSSGSYSGRSSSCACVKSCACACACAGGGRAGCDGRKAFRINLLLKEVKDAQGDTTSAIGRISHLLKRLRF